MADSRMTSIGSSSTRPADPDDNVASEDESSSTDADRGTVVTEDGRPGSDPSPIEAEDLEDLPGTGRSEDEPLEIGEVFELLKNERRRRVIAFLKEQEDGTSTLDVLAEHIAALENDVDVAQLTSSQRKRVYIGLYQCHLPKLDEFGVIEFRKNRGIIHLQDTELLDPYLPGPTTEENADDEDESAAETAVPRRRRLAAAGGVALVTLVGAAGLGPLAAVPATVWTLASVAALLVAAAT